MEADLEERNERYSGHNLPQFKPTNLPNIAQKLFNQFRSDEKLPSA